jgi:hypothetical protein
MVGQLFSSIEKSLLGLNPVNPSFWVMGYTSKGSGQVANFRFSLMSYREAVEKSLEELLAMDKTEFTPIQLAAWEKVRASFEKTLSPTEKHEMGKTLQAQGKRMISTNISFVELTGEFYFEGIITDKKVLVPGEYKPSPQSKPETIARQKIERQLTLAKYRKLNLTIEEIAQCVKFQG